jgi:hypothetical protein
MSGISIPSKEKAMKTLPTLVGFASILAAVMLRGQSVKLQPTPPTAADHGSHWVDGIGISRIQDNGGQVFNVRNAYTSPTGCSEVTGAKGDGVADDTNSINCTIKAAVPPNNVCDTSTPGKGGVVYFPPGVYLVTATLTIDHPCVTLAGAGPDASIIYSSSTSADVVKFGAATAFAPCGGLRHLSVTSGTGRTTATGVIVDGCLSGVIEDVFITPGSGNGIQFGDAVSNLNSSSWYVDKTFVNTGSGAFKGVQVLGTAVNDVRFTGLVVAGNTPIVAGSVGINITGSGTLDVTDSEVVQYEIGVKVAPPTGVAIPWVTFYNVQSDSNSLYGWDLEGAGAIFGLLCTSCWAGSSGTTSSAARGFRINNGDSVILVDPRVVNTGGHGIEIAATNVASVEINGGLITASSLASNGTMDGIHVNNNMTGGLRILNARAGAEFGNPHSQKYGINIGTGCNNFIVGQNDTRANASAGINNGSGTSATKIVANNL